MQHSWVHVLLMSWLLTACGDTTSIYDNDSGQITAIPVSADAMDVDNENDNTIDFLYGASDAPDINILATPVIEMAGLEPGIARAQALESDLAYTPDLESPMTFDEFPVTLQFSEFYDGYDIRSGLILSNKLQSLDGQAVTMEGYVAPPLAPRLDFFVLTRMQLAYCPFCSSYAEWPDDIVLVYLPELRTLSSEYPVRVTGTLHIGASVDAETGMVSLVRIYAEEIERLN